MIQLSSSPDAQINKCPTWEGMEAQITDLMKIYIISYHGINHKKLNRIFSK